MPEHVDIYPLDLEDLRKFLNCYTGKPFLTNSSCECPIATYLANKTGDEVVVSVEGVKLINKRGYYRISKLPGWARLLITLIDASSEPPHGAWRQARPITPQEVLELMNRNHMV